ncbi:hypothetical protein SUNDANCE_166 [Brevibacillus phage Sundance]|uniref:hypothetical protein n=2 Tax=root TaxID=1 RepID=UPI0006BCA7FD|nr:hypothetical protein AVT09_gp166 [Brevibacillus phage Sundance]ALA47982.1 hypothetical protein SUNDANCE_166 [Brevibacillus phage Sundance]
MKEEIKEDCNMQKYRVVVTLATEDSAQMMKEHILKHFPIINGQVEIMKEPERKPLNEIIEEVERK